MTEKYIELCKQYWENPSPEATIRFDIVPKKVYQDDPDNVQILVTLDQKIELQKMLSEIFSSNWRLKRFFEWQVAQDTMCLEQERKWSGEVHKECNKWTPTDIEINHESL